MLKQRYKKRLTGGERVFNIVTVVILAIFALLCILPMLNVLATSFSHYSEVISLYPKNFTFYSYGIVLKDQTFFSALGMSVFVTGVGTLLGLLVIVLAAYPLSKSDLPFRKFLMIFFIITMLFSGGMIPTFIVVKMFGMVDSPLALIVPSLAQVYNIILMKNYFEGLPKELEEATMIDGAGYVGLLFRVILPVSMPMMITIGLFLLVGFWNSYMSALLYIRDNVQFQTLPLYIANLINGSANGDSVITDPERALSRKNIEAATIVLSVLPILVLYPFTLKYFTKGVVVGSVKE